VGWWETTLEVVGAEPFPIKITATNDLAGSPALDEARAKMPPWTEITTGLLQSRHVSL
jgi:hypothetical protein